MAQWHANHKSHWEKITIEVAQCATSKLPLLLNAAKGKCRYERIFEENCGSFVWPESH